MNRITIENNGHRITVQTMSRAIEPLAVPSPRAELDSGWLRAVAPVLSSEELDQSLGYHMDTSWLTNVLGLVSALSPISRAMGAAPGRGGSQQQQQQQRRITKAHLAERVKKRRFRKSDLQKEWSQPQCTICLEKYKSNNTVWQLPCGHDFHPVCIEHWVTTCKADCPVCKRNVF